MTFLLAHRCGEENWYWDNSLDSIKESLNLWYDIIELDVRKSKDWVLYCYHWNVLEILFPDVFLKYKSFETLKRTKNIITLETALDLIQDKAIIFLDIKEKQIISDDIYEIVKWRKFKWLYLSWIFSVKKLLEFKKITEKISNSSLVYVNMNPLKLNYKNLSKRWISKVQCFYRNLNEKIYRNLLRYKIEVAITPLFLTKRKYQEMIKKYNLLYKHTDFS